MINTLIELGQNETPINLRSFLNTFKHCSSQAVQDLITLDTERKEWSYFGYCSFASGVSGDFIVFEHEDKKYRLYYICPNKYKEFNCTVEPDDMVIIVKLKIEFTDDNEYIYLNDKYCRFNARYF